MRHLGKSLTVQLGFGVLNQQSPTLTAQRWNPILPYAASDREYDGVRRVYHLVGQ